MHLARASRFRITCLHQRGRSGSGFCCKACAARNSRRCRASAEELSGGFILFARLSKVAVREACLHCHCLAAARSRALSNRAELRLMMGMESSSCLVWALFSCSWKVATWKSIWDCRFTMVSWWWISASVFLFWGFRGCMLYKRSQVVEECPHTLQFYQVLPMLFMHNSHAAMRLLD